MTKQTHRINEFEFLRFIFALVILFHHAYASNGSVIMRGGYLGVEFFFILSGFFLAKHCKENNTKALSLDNLLIDNLIYLKRRIFAVYPYFIIASIISFIFYINYLNFQDTDFFYFIRLCLNDLYFPQSFGIAIWSLTGVEWFISSFLTVIFILLPICSVFYKLYIYYFAPIFFIFIVGYISVSYGYFPPYGFEHSIISIGSLRAFAIMSFGMILFEISDFIKFTYLEINNHKLFFTVLEVFVYGLSIVLMYRVHQGIFDLQIVLLIGFGVLLTAVQNSYLTWLNKPFFSKLGKLSVCIYLTHYFFVTHFDFLDRFTFFADSSRSGKRNFMILMSLLCAILVYNLVEFYKKYRLSRLKKI